MEEVTRRSSSTGLIIGKFMPPHLGHLHLIEVARSQVEQLTILVCSLAAEPISGHLRYEWMCELAPDARVVHVTDENPSEPHQHPRFWEIWTHTIRRAVPTKPDVLFTSEKYGDELAARLGARHVLVDYPRRHVPVSASMIRERPLAHWQYIPACVRPYFVKRIVVTGSESTGKTRLAGDLAAHYGTVRTPEFAREHLDAKNRPLDSSDIELIARGQIATEEAQARKANRILILDTDLVSTIAYANHYYGYCPPWIVSAARERQADLYLLADIDVPWVADLQRDRPHMREHMQMLFRTTLADLGVSSYSTINGSWAERWRHSCAAIDALLLTA
jgi:NadR type nicotinamide-nucleotide adenylyltransferase